MGAYVYKVTSKRVKCSDGQDANVAIYAYKPSWGWDGDKFNSRMEFRTGCHTARRMAEAGKFSGRIVTGSKDEAGKVTVDPESKVYTYGAGTFLDDSFKYAERLVPGVTIA
jgi:hypothetical protein